MLDRFCFKLRANMSNDFHNAFGNHDLQWQNEMWSNLTSVKLLTTRRLEYDRDTLRSRSARSRSRAPSLSSTSSAATRRSLSPCSSHQKSKHLTLNDQICPVPMAMANEACLGFSAKVVATITDTSAKDDELQTIHQVSVDSPEEDTASSRPSSRRSCSRTCSRGAKRCAGL